jgi:hypothetical protein
MLGFIRTVPWSSKRLPDAVFADLVDIVFTSLPPVALIGVILTAVGILVAAKNNDPVIWALTALSVGVTAGRIALILAYRRRASLEGVHDPTLWDGRYAIGAYTSRSCLARSICAQSQLAIRWSRCWSPA